MVDRSTLQDLGDFVAQRLDEEIRRAERAGDGRGLAFLLPTRDLVLTLRRDVDERPWARAEVGNYLLRSARLYRSHPDYRHWWDAVPDAHVLV